MAQLTAINETLEGLRSDLRAAVALRDSASDRLGQARNRVTDPATLAAAVKSVLPAQGAVSQDQLEAALRKVLGSVDDK